MALEDFRYRLDIRVVFRDIDYYRHVNNAVRRIAEYEIVAPRPALAPVT